MFINSTNHKVWASATKPKGFVTKKIEYTSLIKFYPNQKLSFKFKKNDLEKNNIFSNDESNVNLMKANTHYSLKNQVIDLQSIFSGVFVN